ncbi:MAG: Glutamine--tRNA ligase [Deltaproteobacteria bacterium ADurb.Bin151]|jgi:glutaminyl-tRNA synthetase|nr:glutamine--tRNA ligase/YqeY domain fusion protein [Smithella sp.]OQB55012.1 MAG: Glutamine--tRNA ligase [Deltaproteobacteria bacterium ADurb.Bin151]HOG81412.1 glutamine--tRNA ligase/YqeY domain fusion protein [Smithellaceae bacterium]HOQ41355.1 glutamine--tRNA ligase/YqeY domain fusion protein [Smithellaceae bacterium]HPL65800.1 glutamine--tRNA ligase/YqeY domain fusion protein [Smithellaceae bacterium]
MTQPVNPSPTDFIRDIIDEGLRENKHEGRVATRFPPEPNGYIHIGHAKSVCLNFGIAAQYQGTCNLRLDDTDPLGESMEYVQSIIRDVRWLGFDWGDRLFYASDYFEKLYAFAVELIKTGNAYVCSLSADEMRESRGTFTEAGKESPYRDRSVQENLDLFTRMRQGEFADGAHTLRAKIDMASPNIVMRDPVLYRIKREPHYRTGDQWVIYPMYDFAHCLSDALEGITHSICTLEFENNRPLYDWIVEKLVEKNRPRQIEFARLNLSYTVLSKRRLIELVKKNYVQGWDDPRMPTVTGMRRRGYTPEAIRNFCAEIGVAKNDNLIDVSLLEHCVREDLNEKATRVMCVLHPLKVVIDNYPEGRTEHFEIQNHPQRPELGSRQVPFSRVLYIERDDFMEDPPKKYHRLGPGREVRLRNAYVIKYESMIKNEAGEVVELHCTYDPTTQNGPPADGRKVQGVIHWVSAQDAVTAEVRLYDRLFTIQDPGGEEEFLQHLNPGSLEILSTGYAEASLKDTVPGSQYQFERLGYFCVDLDTQPGKPVFNRVVALRDSWARIAGGK